MNRQSISQSPFDSQSCGVQVLTTSYRCTLPHGHHGRCMHFSKYRVIGIPTPGAAMVLPPELRKRIERAADMADLRSKVKSVRASHVAVMTAFHERGPAVSLDPRVLRVLLQYAGTRSWRGKPKGGTRAGAGRPRDAEKAKNRTLRLRQTTWDLLARLARQRGVSRQVLVAELAEAEQLRVKGERGCVGEPR